MDDASEDVELCHCGLPMADHDMDDLALSPVPMPDEDARTWDGAPWDE